MLVAAVVRNIDDRTGWFRLEERWIEAIGSAALMLFLSMTISTLDLTRLTGAGPALLTVLLTQSLLMALIAVFVIFRDRDQRRYDLIHAPHQNYAARRIAESLIVGEHDVAERSHHLVWRADDRRGELGQFLVRGRGAIAARAAFPHEAFVSRNADAAGQNTCGKSDR